MRERRRRAALQRLVARSIAVAQPWRTRSMADAAVVLPVLLGLLMAGAESAELVAVRAWNSDVSHASLVRLNETRGPAEKRVLSIDTDGHYEVRLVRGSRPVYWSVGQLPAAEQRQLRREVQALRVGRNPATKCSGDDCDTLAVGGGDMPRMLSIDTAHPSPDASVRALIAHVDTLYRRRVAVD
jgi:hypothetical protein